MFRKNVMTVDHYLFESFMWFFFASLLYYAVAFKQIDGLSLDASVNIFCVLIALCGIINTYTTFYRGRNGISLFVNTIIPLGIYTILAYNEQLPVIPIVGIIMFFSVSYIVIAVWCGNTRYNTVKTAKKIQRIIQIAAGVKTITAACFLLFGIVFGSWSLLAGNSLHSAVDEEKPSEREEITIASKIDTISKLDEYTWYGLSAEEKLDILQTVATIEASHFGLPHELTVSGEELGASLNGTYSHTTHTIKVDMGCIRFGTANAALETICHEAYHAYECCLCAAYSQVDSQYRQLLIFDSIDDYIWEFGHYLSSDGGNLAGYYSQACEEAAFTYGNSRPNQYYSAMADYLGWGEESPSS